MRATGLQLLHAVGSTGARKLVSSPWDHSGNLATFARAEWRHRFDGDRFFVASVDSSFGGTTMSKRFLFVDEEGENSFSVSCQHSRPT